MKIITMNDKGTGHVLVADNYTACGKRYPGKLGPQLIHRAELQLCRTCHHVMRTGYKWHRTLMRQISRPLPFAHG